MASPARTRASPLMLLMAAVTTVLASSAPATSSANGASCCFSKWGDKNSCGGYPAKGQGGICSTDWSKSCTGPGSCPATPPPPPPPTPPPTPPPPTPPPSPAHVTVSSTGTARVTNMTYGANLPNYVSSSFVGASGDAMIKASGATHIRWPGGNYANMLIWDDDYSICKSFSKYKSKNSPSWTFTWQVGALCATSSGLNATFCRFLRRSFHT